MQNLIKMIYDVTSTHSSNQISMGISSVYKCGKKLRAEEKEKEDTDLKLYGKI